MHIPTFVQQFRPHPATLQLLRFQAAARLSKTWSRFRGRRRLVLSILAILLAVIWLGQVAISLVLREPADPQKLAVWIPMGMLAYAIWHVLKTACRSPIEPFEWTPAEQELLGGAPLKRHELVMYRLLAIATAAIAKAACFSLVMLPDLRIWFAGFMGMLLGLLFIDLVRMSFEITAYGMSRKEFVAFRVAVLGGSAFCLVLAVVTSLPLPTGAAPGELPTSLAISLHILNSLIDLRQTAIGSVLEAPFHIFSNVILARTLSIGLALEIATAVALVVSLGACVVWLDSHFERRRLSAERRQFNRLQANSQRATQRPDVIARPLRIPLRLRGAGALAWRQTLGAVHYRTSLCVAMIVPGFLSCLTLLTPHNGLMMVVQLMGGLVFYSFLLLPTAFKFDFRRDIDRLSVLKSLPVSPIAITLGQLTVPVMLTTLFQVVVLLIASLFRPYHPGLFIAAVLLLIPTNFLIFSLENLIFLLYPYRLNQEGLGVFFRSILTFTGKGILFAAALAVALAWALIAREVTAQLFPGSANYLGGITFAIGMWALITAAATGTTALLVGSFRRFDPSQDTPAA